MPSKATLVKIGIAVGAVIGGSLAGASIAAPIVSLAQSEPTVTDTAGAVTGDTLPQVTRAQTPSTTDEGDDVQKAPRGPHVVGDCTEASLSNEDEAKVKAAVGEEVPGATIDRIETDCDTGAAYEAHLTKSDGARATAFLNEVFEVTSVEEGHGGPGGPGGLGRGPQPAESDDATSG